MAVIQVLDRPASFYTVAGRLLFIECVNLQLRNLIEQLFAGWQLTPVSSVERPPDIRICFFCGDRPPDIPEHLNQFEIAGGGQCYTGGGELYLALEDSLLHLRETAVDVWFAELPGANDPRLATMTSFAVCAALRRFGMFDLHSAGVVEPRGKQGVLIVGASGSGKSTLALQLVLAGWAYLSDDEVLLSLVDGAVEARGFRSFFAVRNGPGIKDCFKPDIAKRASHASPGLVLFTQVSGGSESRVCKLTQSEAMMRLIRACPWATYDTSIASANLAVLSALARQARAYELFAGCDLLRPNHAAKFLSELN
jgi:hypothetical protein